MSDSKALKPIEYVKQALDTPQYTTVLKNALPTHVPLEKFKRTTYTVLQQDPGLLECDRPSLFHAIVSAAQLGLVPDKQLGQAYFVPFYDKEAQVRKVQMIPGYRGLVQLARQSGELSTIEADVICERDEIEWTMGDDSKFTVRPGAKNKDSIIGDRGAPIGVYAIARFKDGGTQRVVMTREQIEKIRNNSPTGSSPAWRTNWDEMAKKTAVRRLLKMCPLNTEANTALAISENFEELGRPGYVSEHRAPVIEHSDEPPAPAEPAPEKPKAKPKNTAKPKTQPVKTGEVIDEATGEVIPQDDPEDPGPDESLLFAGESAG